MTSVLTAVTHRLEAEFVRVLEGAADVTLVRRCADVAELLSAGAAGVARVAVVSPDLRGLDRDALRHLAGHGVRVAGLVATGDEEGERRLRQLGVATILRPGDDAGRRWPRALVGARRVPPRPGSPVPTPRRPARAPASAVADRRGPAAGRHRPRRRRRRRARRCPPRSPWSGGPTGAPGPHHGRRHPRRPAGRRRACAPCSSTSTPGAPAWRRCSAWSTRRPGSPRRPAPPSRAPSTCPGWPGSRPRSCPACGCSPACRGPTGGPSCAAAAVEDVLRLARGVVDHVVVDVGFAVEDDEELSYDTAAPRRNAATLTALEAADHLVVVGRGRPGRAAAARPGGAGRRRAALAAARPSSSPRCAPSVAGSSTRARHRRRARPVRRHGCRALPAVGARRVRRRPARRAVARRGRPAGRRSPSRWPSSPPTSTRARRRRAGGRRRTASRARSAAAAAARRLALVTGSL